MIWATGSWSYSSSGKKTRGGSLELCGQIPPRYVPVHYSFQMEGCSKAHLWVGHTFSRFDASPCSWVARGSAFSTEGSMHLHFESKENIILRALRLSIPPVVSQVYNHLSRDLNHQGCLSFCHPNKGQLNIVVQTIIIAGVFFSCKLSVALYFHLKFRKFKLVLNSDA